MGDGLAKVRITLLKLSINMFLQKSTCLYLVGWIAAWFSFLNYSYNITNQWQLLQNTHDRTKGKGFRHFCRHFFRILKKITLSCRTFNLTNRFQTYSGSTIELQNPQILKKMLQNQVSFVIREALWTEKLNVALDIAERERIRSEKLRLRSTQFEFSPEAVVSYTLLAAVL